MVAAVVPLSGACLVLEDLDGAMLFDIVPGGLSWSNTGDEATMTNDIIGKCLNPPDLSISLNTNVLDIMYQRDNGTKQTMRELIVGKMKDQIISKFTLIEDKLNTLESPNLAGDPTVTQLRALLRDTPMDAMLVADGEKMVEQPKYQPLLLNYSGIAIALASSAACSDLKLADDEAYQELAGRTVPGIETIVNILESFGQLEANEPTCAKKVVCENELTAEGQQRLFACEAANQVINLKRQLITSRSHRCDIFETASGEVCDPANMREHNGTWTGDCLHESGGMVVKDVKCSLQEFTEYTKKFDERMDKVFSRLDQTVNEIKDEITTQLRQLVEREITQPIDRVADGVNCGFIGSHYQGVVDGMCYQVVYGLRVIGWCFVACGILALLLVLVIHSVWRAGIDNVKLWENNVGNNAEGEVSSI